MSDPTPATNPTVSAESVDRPGQPFGVYVHLPWCVKKCPYCDFNSHAIKQDLPEAQYLRAVKKDIEMEADHLDPRRITSVFFGGGTPSLFSDASIGEILDALERAIGIDSAAEITLEANPGTAEAQRFKGYRRVGVNRLSIGVQSFDDATLTQIGRIHDGREALAAIDYARTAGFDNYNIDLMYAQPGQSTSLALADVRSALACEPNHLSCYQLTIEPNTLFHAHPPELPDEEAAWAIQESLAQELTHADFHNYEVSAWARPGQQSRHNTNYWSYGDYLGIGAGAHGKITTEDKIVRTAKLKHPTRFMEHAGTTQSVGTRSEVEGKDRSFEFMLNALRLTEGFNFDEFSLRTGLERQHIQPTLDDASARGLIEFTEAGARPTALGRRFLNDLTGMFL